MLKALYPEEARKDRKLRALLHAIEYYLNTMQTATTAIEALQATLQRDFNIDIRDIQFVDVVETSPEEKEQK